MNNKITPISTAMLAFSTFFGIMIASLYYLYQIKSMTFSQVILYVIIYIDLNLIVLYYVKKLVYLK